MNSRLGGAALLCALVAAGCGGGDDTDEPAAETTTKTAATVTTPPATTEEAAAPAGLTAPGTKLSYGDMATVGWVPPSESLNGNMKDIKLEATVVSVEKGSAADLKGLDLDADQKGSIPWFMKVKIKNLGRTAPKADDPDTAFDVIDDHDQEQSSIIFLGDFPRCENTSAPKPFSKGK